MSFAQIKTISWRQQIMLRSIGLGVVVVVMILCTASGGASAVADLGVDTGRVISSTYLFTSPDAASPRVGRLPAGSLTVLVARKVTNGWLHVIQYSTGHEGWVIAKRLATHYTHRPNPDVSLGSEAGTSDSDPVLVITNNADKRLYLHIGSTPEVTIGPRANKTVTVSPGLYPFNVSAADVIPSFGSKYFVPGDTYTWSFYIGNDTGSTSVKVSAAERAEMDSLRAYITSHEPDIDNTKTIIDTQKSALNQQQTNLDTEKANIDSTRTSLDQTDQSAVDAFNQSIDTYNSDLQVFQQAEDAFNSKVDDYNTQLNALNEKKQRLDALADKVNSR